jgi:bifunctional DNase/RNase
MAEPQLHPLTVHGIVQQDEQEDAILVLVDDLARPLPIPIGLCERRAIQFILEKQSSPRPLTHDLFVVLAEQCDATISRVIIDDYSGGTFYARLILNSTDGPVSLDCRPSDGVAIALQAGAPIFVTATLMDNLPTGKKSEE